MAHLTRSQRDQLQALRSAGHTQQNIAMIIDCHQSTVSREIQRSSPPIYCRYTATVAQACAKERRRQSYEKRPRWYDDVDVIRYVVQEIRDGKSPDAIAGRMKRESPWHLEHAVSHESIYRYIWKVKEEGGVLHLHLPRQGKRPRFYGLQRASASAIPHRRDISERPEIVNKKKRCGDWESDLVVSGHNGSGVIATFVERISKYVQAVLLMNRTADAFVRAAREVFQKLPEPLRRTLTHDNGSEIAKHEQITDELKITVYCAKPYSAWQRGLNEHTNGMLRRFFPKGTDFSKILPTDVAMAVEKINNLPRRSLQYLTPKEVFLSEVKKYAFQS